MRNTLAAFAAATVALAPTPALAHDEESEVPPPFTSPACGGVTIEITRFDLNFKERESSFMATGIATFRVSDEDSSVELSAPGRFQVTTDPATGVATIVSTGRTLLFPETSSQQETLRDRFGSDLVLVNGRIVITERVDPATGMPVPGSERIVSSTPKVTDVCALLRR